MKLHHQHELLRTRARALELVGSHERKLRPLWNEDDLRYFFDFLQKPGSSWQSKLYAIAAVESMNAGQVPLSLKQQAVTEFVRINVPLEDWRVSKEPETAANIVAKILPALYVDPTSRKFLPRDPLFWDMLKQRIGEAASRDELRADAILFAGEMQDYVNQEIWETLREPLESARGNGRPYDVLMTLVTLRMLSPERFDQEAIVKPHDLELIEGHIDKERAIAIQEQMLTSDYSIAVFQAMVLTASSIRISDKGGLMLTFQKTNLGTKQDLPQRVVL